MDRFDRYAVWPPNAKREEIPVLPAPTVRPARYLSGCDLGKLSDHSAAATVLRTWDGRAWCFDVVGLKRWPLRTPYMSIAEELKGMFAAPPLAKSTLAVDCTGVGEAVYEMIQRSGITAQLRPVSITCGRKNSGRSVAKANLVSAVQAPLSSGRLRFAAGLELAKVLETELGNFSLTINEATRNESWGATREGQHDDLVLSVAMALFCGNQPDVTLFFAET